jgi:hypothetical protein
VTAGFPSDATENAAQSSLTAAGYQMGAVTGHTNNGTCRKETPSGGPIHGPTRL